MAGPPPRPIPVFADAVDLEERANHLKQVLNALSAHVTAIVNDTAHNVLGGLDLRQVDAFLSDFASDMTGTLQHAVAHSDEVGRGFRAKAAACTD